MDLSTETFPPRLQPGPVSPAAGSGLNAVGVSTLVHATLALLGISAGLTQTADLQLQAGTTASRQAIALTAVFAPAKTPLETVELRGVETAEVADRSSEELVPVEPVPIALGQAPAVPAPPTRGRPDAEREVEPAEVAKPKAAAAPAQQASASAEAPGAKVDQHARPLPSNEPPGYPPAAIAENRQGRTVLKVVVDAEGQVTSVAVIHSSGHADLDQAAVMAVRNWTFSPALQQQTPVAQTIAVPIRFVNQRES